MVPKGKRVFACHLQLELWDSLSNTKPLFFFFATLTILVADPFVRCTQRISKKYEGTGYNGKQSYVCRVALIQHQDLTRRRHNLELLRQDFLESRKRVAAGLTGRKAAPSRQTHSNGERRDATATSLGMGPAPTQTVSTLGPGQQAIMPTQFDSNNFAAAALSRFDLAVDPAPSNFVMMTNLRRGVMANYLQESDPRFDPIFEAPSTGAMGNFPLGAGNSLATAALFPTGRGGRGLSVPLAVHATSMGQNMLDRVTAQSLLQQRMINASLLGGTHASALPPARYSSQSTQDEFLLSQLRRDHQQRQFFQRMTERAPSRTLSSSMNLTSRMAQSRQEESKGQEESKRANSGLDDDAPAPKRQRNS